MTDAIEAIIFSRPGETSLISYVAALWAGESGAYLDDVKVWICPSTTCLVSVLKICGYTCFDISVFLMSISQLSQTFIPFKNVVNLGVSLEAVKSSISKMIIAKWDNIPTLEELYVRMGVTIVGIGMCLDRQEVEYIHRETYSDMSLLDLICLSLATPGVYRPFKIKGEMWIDASIIEPFSPKSIILGSEKVLAITSKQRKISFNSNDPLGQSKNIMRICFESLRQIVSVGNMNVVEITPSRGGHVGEIRKGWEAFWESMGKGVIEKEVKMLLDRNEEAELQE